MTIRQEKSTALKNPIVDDSPEAMRVYIGLLERRNYFLNMNELKLRAALELATGVSWDSEDIAGLEGKLLETKVAKNMARGLNLPLEKAHALVRHHRAMANPAQVKTPEDQNTHS